MRKKTDICSRALQSFVNAEIPLSAVKAAGLFDEAHRELCVEFDLYPETITKTYSDGVDSWDLGQEVVDVRSVLYVTGAGTGQFYILEALDPATEDRDVPGWRLDPRGTPERFYLEGAKLYTHPKHLLNTVNNYPKLDIHTMKCIALGQNDEIPPKLRNGDFYLHYIRAAHAVDINDSRHPEFARLKEVAMNAVESYMGTRNSSYDRVLKPRAGSVHRTRVV